MNLKNSISACLVLLGTTVAAVQGCGAQSVAVQDAGSKVQTDAATDAALDATKEAGPQLCEKSACGPIPPGEPCPAGKESTSTCERGSGGGCAWNLQCVDKPATGLKWWRTCGDPVCNTNGDAGADAGPDPVCEKEGAACSQKGTTCGNPKKNCGQVLVCDDHDPTQPGCPVSSAKFKDDIHYLRAGELEQLHAETMSIRLATYQYKGQFADPNPTHLGFVIEDQPQSLAVDRGHDRVDMYGYLSMVVAAMQVQEKEIAALRKELREAKSAPACSSSSVSSR